MEMAAMQRTRRIPETSVYLLMPVNLSLPEKTSIPMEYLEVMR